MNYHIGQHVACLTSNWGFSNGKSAKEYGIKTPIKGRVYTIRALIQFPTGTHFLLEEIINKQVTTREGSIEPPFHSSNFKPLQKLTPDMFKEDILDV